METFQIVLICIQSFLLAYLSLFVAIVIHEIGHLIVTICVGHKIQEFSVSLLRIQKMDNKYRIFLQNRFIFGRVMYEREFSKTSCWSEIMITLGGVSANLILGSLFLAESGIYEGLTLEMLNVYSIVMGMLGVHSIMAGLLSLVPGTDEDGLHSDGRKLGSLIALAILEMLQDKPKKKSLLAVRMKERDFIKTKAVKIEFFNNDVMPADYVVDLLQNFFYLDNFATYVFTLDIHQDKNPELGWFPASIAERCVTAINMQAQNDNYPNLCAIKDTNF